VEACVVVDDCVVEPGCVVAALPELLKAVEPAQPADTTTPIISNNAITCLNILYLFIFLFPLRLFITGWL
jgi:hypothetical protein